MKAKRLLLAAGGTGGHMFPAQALAEHLKREGWSIAMMTDARGKTHAGRIPAEAVIEVEAASISPRRPIKAFKGALKLAQGTVQAKSFIKAFNPDAVVGFGGYPAFPAMRAAQSLGLPTVLHEQNAVLGRVNRVFAAKATVVASGFEVLKKCPKGTHHVCTGNPLRDQIIKSIPKDYAAPTHEINLLIIGGSLGAKILSERIPAAIALLPEALQQRLMVVQQTRSESVEVAQKIYKACGIKAVCKPFFDDIEQHLARAHYIIGRAGASSVSEIAAMGKPSLLIPLAIAMDDHQTFNARTLKDRGAADILPESAFTSESVKTTLTERLNDSTWLAQAAKAASLTARPNAAHALADLVVKAAV